MGEKQRDWHSCRKAGRQWRNVKGEKDVQGKQRCWVTQKTKQVMAFLATKSVLLQRGELTASCSSCSSEQILGRFPLSPSIAMLKLEKKAQRREREKSGYFQMLALYLPQSQVICYSHSVDVIAPLCCSSQRSCIDYLRLVQDDLQFVT